MIWAANADLQNEKSQEPEMSRAVIQQFFGLYCMFQLPLFQSQFNSVRIKFQIFCKKCILVKTSSDCFYFINSVVEISLLIFSMLVQLEHSDGP